MVDQKEFLAVAAEHEIDSSRQSLKGAGIAYLKSTPRIHKHRL